MPREENWGLAVNEAMAAKNAIISSNSVGSARDLIKNNYNGYIFKNNDYKSISEVCWNGHIQVSAGRITLNQFS